MTSEGQQAGQQPAEATSGGPGSGGPAEPFGPDGFPPDADGRSASAAFPTSYAPPQATPNGGSPFVVPTVFGPPPGDRFGAPQGQTSTPDAAERVTPPPFPPPAGAARVPGPPPPDQSAWAPQSLGGPSGEIDGYAPGSPTRARAGLEPDEPPANGRPPGVSAFGDQRIRVPGATLTGLPDAPPPGRGDSGPLPLPRPMDDPSGPPRQGRASDLPMRSPTSYSEPDSFSGFRPANESSRPLPPREAPESGGGFRSPRAPQAFGSGAFRAPGSNTGDSGGFGGFDTDEDGAFGGSASVPSARPPEPDFDSGSDRPLFGRRASSLEDSQSLGQPPYETDSPFGAPNDSPFGAPTDSPYGGPNGSRRGSPFDEQPSGASALPARPSSGSPYDEPGAFPPPPAESPYAENGSPFTGSPYGAPAAGSPFDDQPSFGPRAGGSPYGHARFDDQPAGGPTYDEPSGGSPYGARPDFAGPEFGGPDDRGSDSDAIYGRPPNEPSPNGFAQRVPGASFAAGPPSAEPRNGSVPQPRESGDHAPEDRPATGTARPVSASASVPLASRVAPAEDEVPPPPAPAPQARVYGRATPPPVDTDDESDQDAPDQARYGQQDAPSQALYGRPDQDASSPALYGRPDPDGSDQALYGRADQDGSDQALYGRADQGSPYGRPDQDASSRPLYGRPDPDAPSQPLYGRPDQDASSQPLYGRPEQDAPSQPLYGRPEQDASSQALYGRPVPDARPADDPSGAPAWRNDQESAWPAPGSPSAYPPAAFPPGSGAPASYPGAENPPPPPFPGSESAPTSFPGAANAPAWPGSAPPPVAPQSPPGRVSGRATASARVTPPPGSGAPNPPGTSFSEPTTDVAGRGRPNTPGDQYSEHTTDISGRSQGQPYVPSPALSPMHARPPLENGFPPPPDGTENPERLRMGGVFPGPPNRPTVTPPSGPDNTASWPTPAGAPAPSEDDQSRFDRYRPDAEPEAAAAPPPTPHVRMLPVLIGVIIGAALLVGLAIGVVWLIARGSDHGGFSVSAGDCVKKDGSEAVKATCGDPGSYQVVSIADTKDKCADPNQPYVLNPTKDGKTQVLCLKAAN